MKLIFDIGYNKGAFAKECFATYPFCVVVGVEPNPCLTDFSDQVQKHSAAGRAHWKCHEEFMQEAIETMIHNRSTGRLKLIAAAAGSAPGGAPISFHLSPMEPGIATASREFRMKSRFALGSELDPNPRSQWAPVSGIRVPSTTLDEIVEQHGSPDLIKIDVEGYEYEVLKGLSTRQNKICFEWTEEMPHVLHKGVEHLQSIGYQEFGIIGYFVEGQYSQTVTFNEQGDPFLVEPDNYYAWEEIEIDEVIQPDRRINYGMLFAR